MHKTRSGILGQTYACLPSGYTGARAVFRWLVKTHMAAMVGACTTFVCKSMKTGPFFNLC